MSNLYFEPWIGKNYGNGSFKKFLILGESHYTTDNPINVKSKKFTCEVIQSHLQKNNSVAFFTKLAKLINIKTENVNGIWNYVAYSNVIQKLLESSKEQPTEKYYKQADIIFENLCDKLNPEYVLICSKRMWNEWLTHKSFSEYEVIKKNGLEGEIYTYEHSNSKILTMGINHPSSIGFKVEKWKPMVKHFMSYKH